MNAPMILSPEALAKIDKAVAKYPADRRQSAVIAALKRNRRGIAVSFHTAGMMPTDSFLLIRGAGMDQEKTGQMQPFTYQCQWDGSSITDATFALSVK